MDNETRLQAYLARAGVASRRASEELIREGRVRVNGEAAELGSKVQPGRDIVEVDGRVVRMRRAEWVMLHKPRGYVTTRDDPGGRKTIYDLLPDELRHLFHVGRLDRDSSGLLLLTNDGEAANRLLHPSFETTKEYLADVEGAPDDAALRELVRGVRLEDGVGRAEEVELTGETRPGVFRLRMVMREGRNREVRRMLEAIGHPVRRLFRRRFGSIELGRLAPGRWRVLGDDEVARLTGREERPRRPRGRAAGRGRPEPRGTPRGRPTRGRRR
ncbi:MAG TPA: pseudouridine synthase [Longimicrobiaceae bacterium]|nr:pseudouridine synthase [Longimicrobiaceae bacterium]